MSRCPRRNWHCRSASRRCCTPALPRKRRRPARCRCRCSARYRLRCMSVCPCRSGRRRWDRSGRARTLPSRRRKRTSGRRMPQGFPTCRTCRSARRCRSTASRRAGCTLRRTGRYGTLRWCTRRWSSRQCTRLPTIGMSGHRRRRSACPPSSTRSGKSSCRVQPRRHRPLWRRPTRPLGSRLPRRLGSGRRYLPASRTH